MTTSVTRRGALAALAGLAFAPVGLDAGARGAGSAGVAHPCRRVAAQGAPRRSDGALGRRGRCPRLWRGRSGRALRAARRAARSSMCMSTTCSCRRIRRGGARIIDEISGFVLLSGPGAPPLPARHPRRHPVPAEGDRPADAGRGQSSPGVDARRPVRPADPARPGSVSLGVHEPWAAVLRADFGRRDRRSCLGGGARSRRRPWLAQAPTRRKRRSAAARRSSWSGRNSR